MLLITLRGERMVEKSNSNPSLQRVSIRALELNHWRPVFKFIWCCRCLIWETNLWRTVFGFRFMGYDWWFDSDLRVDSLRDHTSIWIHICMWRMGFFLNLIPTVQTMLSFIVICFNYMVFSNKLYIWKLWVFSFYLRVQKKPIIK